MGKNKETFKNNLPNFYAFNMENITLQQNNSDAKL